MNILEVLKADHEIHRALIRKLSEPQIDSTNRLAILTELKNELSLHDYVGEHFFYRPLINNEMTQALSKKGLAEHHEINDLVGDLEHIEIDSSAWKESVGKLEEKIIKHLEDEEQELFQIANQLLSSYQKEFLFEKYSSYVQENVEN